MGFFSTGIVRRRFRPLGIEGGRDGFGAIVDYIDVGQCQGAGHFTEEGGFFVVRFDQGQMEIRSPDF